MAMTFFTRVNFLDRLFTLSYRDRILLLGSCFSQHMGDFLSQHLFLTDVNPFGVLYNPASIAGALQQLIAPRRFTEEELLLHDGLYHSLSHHGHFSASTPQEVLRQIDARYQPSVASFASTTHFMITFGTAYCFRWKETGAVVANCHKLPEQCFERVRLSLSEIVDEWSQLIMQLSASHPTARMLFTVSPIRHWRDGAHDNQLSKSTLLLAIEELQQRFPSIVSYFPAYELMMDELRDYRFYAEDMCHPSKVAIEYIRERLVEAYMDEETRTILREVGGVRKMLSHRPLHVGDEAHRATVTRIFAKIAEIEAKYPYLCFDEAKAQLTKQIEG